MRLMLLSVVFLLADCNASAQIQAGRIVGTITDPNQAAVANASVLITNLATNQAQSLSTSTSGDFVLTPVNPGIYRVEVRAAGFSPAEVDNVEVVVGQSTRADVILRIGAISTKVEVSARAPLLNTESGTLGQEITNKQVTDLPLNGRSYYELARLTPGATLLPGGGNLLRIRANYQSGTAISGIRGSQTSFYMDGVDITDHHQGGTLIQTSIDALDEFQIQQSEYSAEFRNAGGGLNGTTKSGTSEFHGVLFEFLRNDKLDARNFFAPQRDILKRNQFGGSIGGPFSIPKLYRKRGTFFFVNYEGMRERAGLVLNSVVPTVAEKSGDFSAPGLNTIYDPTSGAPFLGNKIPGDRISQQARFFMAYLPDPNSGNRAIFLRTRPLDQDQFSVRFDQTITPQHRAFVRWSFLNYQENDPNAFPALGYASLNSRAHNVVGALISNLTPSLINEVRYSYLPNSIDLEAYLQGTDFYAQAGVPGFEVTGHRPGVAGSFPDFSWSGYTSLAGSTFDQRPKTQDLKVTELNENLTWVKGRHILKFGMQFRHWVPLFTDSGAYEGNWHFDGGKTAHGSTPRTGDAFADFLLGIPRSVDRTFPADWFGGYANYWHFYTQDDIKVNSRLTLNLGLRYEYSPWLNGYRGQVGTFLPNSPRPIAVQGIDLDAQFAAPTAYALFGNLIETCSQAGIARNCTATDNAQWAPRFGFAWRPWDDKTVLRGGYGIFYEVESSGDRVNHFMVPYQLSETVNNDTVPQRTMADFFVNRPIGSATTNPSLAGGYPRMSTGSDQHWSFGLQRQLPATAVMEVNYVGNRGAHLSEMDPVNIPPAGPGSIQSRRPYPLFGSINYTAQDGSSIYHALQAKFEKRASHGLWYLASYTWSKSISVTATPARGGDFAYERALSSFDIPHNLTISAGYELPFGRGKAFLSSANRFENTLLGGWQMQTIVILRSGRPFTPTVSRDYANTGVGGQRPNRIGSGKLDHPTVAQWFDKSAFTVPQMFTYGNSAANILREDRFKDVDFSLFKQFQLNERARLQFRAEAFNLTNTASFAAPNTSVDTASGGQVSSTISTARNIQFALKVSF